MLWFVVIALSLAGHLGYATLLAFILLIQEGY